jgi:hypothetical protein
MTDRKRCSGEEETADLYQRAAAVQARGEDLFIPGLKIETWATL